MNKECWQVPDVIGMQVWVWPWGEVVLNWRGVWEEAETRLRREGAQSI